MAFSDNGFQLSIPPMLDIPRMVVEKITDTFLGEDSKIYYKVKWQETWEPEEKMMSMCAHIVNDFWKEYYAKSQKQKQTMNNPVLRDVSISSQKPSCTNLFEIDRFETSTINNSKNLEHNGNIAAPLKNFYASSFERNKSMTNDDLLNDHSGVTESLNGINSSNEPLSQYPPVHIISANESCRKNMSLVMHSRPINTNQFLNTNFTPILPHPTVNVPTKKPLENTSEQTPNKVKSKYKRCTICEEECENLIALKKHVRARHKQPEKRNCNLCNKTFKTMTALKRHMLTHDSAKPHTCPECGKGFKEKSNMTKHMKIHTGVRPYTCDVCNAQFRQLCHMLKHALIHKGEKPYKCEQCNKVFRRKEHLKEHKVIHSGTFPFQCHICDKKFNFRANLRNHIAQHDGSKKFVCGICGKAFPGKANLTQHLSIHENGSHVCNICNKKFTKKNQLRKHVKASHSSGDHLSCDLCDDIFVSIEEFQQHLLKHIGPTPYSCPECNKKFVSEAKLISHKACHKISQGHSVKDSDQRKFDNENNKNNNNNDNNNSNISCGDLFQNGITDLEEPDFMRHTEQVENVSLITNVPVTNQNNLFDDD